MGNVQGYCKHVDDKDSTRHLIKINQLHDKNWKDKFVYDFQNNEVGKIENGKFVSVDTRHLPNIGECYAINFNGEIKIFFQKYLLEILKNAAIEHINKAIESKEDKDLIRL